MKYNRSEIMKNAWTLFRQCKHLVAQYQLTFSECLRRAWAKAKKAMEEIKIMKNTVDELVKNLEGMLYGNIYIHEGIDREVSVKVWEKDGKKRTYLNINCYTAAGRCKTQYKCGYVDMITNEYVAGKYDDVDAKTATYIGR